MDFDTITPFIRKQLEEATVSLELTLALDKDDDKFDDKTEITGQRLVDERKVRDRRLRESIVGSCLEGRV